MYKPRFKVVFSNERIISPSGLGIVGGMLAKSDFVKRCNRIPIDKRRSEPQIKNGDILLTYIGLLCQAKTPFEAVNEMKDDPEFYKDALGIVRGIPSVETLRQRMDDIGSSLRAQILQANVDMFRTHTVVPSALPTGEVPLDIDVTPFDNSKTNKEGVSRTYKGFDGYAPIMASIGNEGFLVNTELREGKQHCQKGTPRFLEETLHLSHELTDASLLIRMDSGNDAKENLGILLEDGDWLIVKRNPRSKETKDEWLAKVKDCCKDIRNPRDGKVVYVGSSWKDVEYVTSDGEVKTICMRIVYEVIERTIDKYGQILLSPDIELNTWWTNLGWTDDAVIASSIFASKAYFENPVSRIQEIYKFRSKVVHGETVSEKLRIVKLQEDVTISSVELARRILEYLLLAVADHAEFLDPNNIDSFFLSGYEERIKKDVGES